MTEQIFVVTECGCRFQVVSALPVLAGGFLQIQKACRAHKVGDHDAYAWCAEHGKYGVMESSLLAWGAHLIQEDESSEEEVPMAQKPYVVDTEWLTQKIEEAAQIVHGASFADFDKGNMAQLERFEVIAFRVVLKELLVEDPPEPEEKE